MWLVTFTHLTLNQTQSLPYHAFFCIKGLKVRRGDLVCLKGHESDYAGDLSLTKRLAGLPGDSIALKDGQIVVAGRKVGRMQSHTQDGKPLHPLQSRVVPEGMVFVAGDHPRSFDSRYGEFGLVDGGCVQGRCFGLFRKRSATP
jgi:conjugal transfer pilin signal peptidase TrbI